MCVHVILFLSRQPQHNLMTYYSLITLSSDTETPYIYMTKESKSYYYKPLDLTQIERNRTMPTNTDSGTKLVIASPELPKINKTSNLKVSQPIYRALCSELANKKMLLEMKATFFCSRKARIAQNGFPIVWAEWGEMSPKKTNNMKLKNCRNGWRAVLNCRNHFVKRRLLRTTISRPPLTPTSWKPSLLFNRSIWVSVCYGTVLIAFCA